MSLPIRTGIVVATEIVKHLCRVLTTWRPGINSVIDAAVSGSIITTTQAAVLKAWLDGTAAACDILRLVSGY